MLQIIKKLFRSTKKSFSSADYWEERYKAGKNSGSGSYNKLAEFKADFINTFLSEKSIKSVIEFGCGDGNQLSMINYFSYLGLDVSPTSIQLCKRKFKDDHKKKFLLYNPFAFDEQAIHPSDLTLSLDVIYHLVENQLYELHMKHLFQSANRYVIIYSSDYENEQVNHERRRSFTTWIKGNQPQWELVAWKENLYKNETDESNLSLSDFFVYQKVSRVQD